MLAASAPAFLPQPFAAGAAGANIRTIPNTTADSTAASLQLGFPPATFAPIPLGGTPPNGSDFNGILNWLSQINQWQQAGGFTKYNAAFSTAIGGYPNGAILEAAANTGFWVSTEDSNTSDPDTGGANWNFAPLVGAANVPYNAIGGFIISAITGTNTTAGLSISAGQATALLGSATAQSTQITETTTTAWLASNGNAINGTDAGSSTLADSTTYHVFMCSGASGTGCFVSASLTPTFPTGYAVSARRVGSFNTTAAGAPIPYTSIEYLGGGSLNWLTTQTQDISTSSLSMTLVLYALNIPSGIKVSPLCRFLSTTTEGIIITSGDETNVAPTAAASVPGFDVTGTSTTVLGVAHPLLTSNTSGQIGARSSSGSTNLYEDTRGWIDFRRV